MDFWARRRAAVEAEAQAEARAEEARRAEAAVSERAARQSDKTDDEWLEELGLPEPESIGPDGDFKAFLADGIPERLRKRALRCLWRSNPVLANVDGLVDYGEDFTDAACVIENMQTAYQVGKGMLAHVEELERQAKALDEVSEAHPAETETAMSHDADVDPCDTEMDEDVPGAVADETCVAAPYAFSDEGDADEMAPPPRRRMAFTFDDSTA